MLCFVDRYGWRAYALPVLVALTIATLLHPVHAAQRGLARSQQPAAVDQPAGQPHAPAATPSTTFTGGAVMNLPMVTDSKQCLGNTAPKLVLVSIREQHAWMCERNEQVYSTAATTGAISHNNGTPAGSWLVQAKQTNRYLTGPGYREFVHFWLPYSGDFGFHDAPWQTMPFGSPDYQTLGSHGCVHLPDRAMAWLYAWAQVGTTVTVQH